MKYVPDSFKHHPNIIRMQKLTKTKLPYPHTREERLAEIKALKGTFPEGGSEITYCNCIMDGLLADTDEAYFNRLTFLYKLTEGYNALSAKDKGKI